MKITTAGAVVEYNPFHNGHLFHLQESKRLTGADYFVCVMSGHFLQRGEPALVDKWARAAMAVSAGVDVVFELPYIFAGQTAEVFASGAVALLQATGVVTHLCFGSETTDLDLLMPAVRVLCDEPEEYQLNLKADLNRGLAFPAARQKALLSYLKQTASDLSEEDRVRLQKALSRPNAILAIEYLKALHKSKSRIEPVPVQRTGADYHDSRLAGSRIASATAIRLQLERTWQSTKGTTGCSQALTQIAGVVPPATFHEIHRSISQGRGPVFCDHFTQILQYILRTSTAEQIRDIADVREGIEHKIIALTRQAYPWKSILDQLKSRRFPRTSLQRILIQILMQYTRQDAEMTRSLGPRYLRVLGFSERGKTLLRAMKDSASLPIVHRPAALEKELWNQPHTPLQQSTLRMLELDRRTTDIYVLGFSDPDQRASGQDYTTYFNQ